VVIYLFRSKEKLQTKYTDDLVKATGALRDLTAEYLKQSFTDSAGWQDRYKGFEDTFKKHTSDDAAADMRIEGKLSTITTELDKHETRMKEHVDRAVERLLHALSK